MKRRKKNPILSTIAAKYFELSSLMSVAFKRGLMFKRGYTCQKHPALVAIFGCEGDRHAPIAYIDGNYFLRDRGNLFITFGGTNICGKINWYNKEGWLPCLVSEFKNSDFEFIIESFADKCTICKNDFEIVYSRVIIKNISNVEKNLPKVSGELICLNKYDTDIISPFQCITLDFAIGADRFGEKYSYPTDDEISAMGGYDLHYEKMKSYWCKRIECLAHITKLPDKNLINAYKAGYVYTMIVKDSDRLNVGENGYDRVFDHDVIGIIATLLTLGDFKDFKKYSEYILQNVQYPDARWKFSWVFALYLQKTNDIEYVRNKFEEIKSNTHFIEKDRCDSGTGIMRKTMAIDSNGYWTIDNWSALFGLLTYRFICERLCEKEEFNWAKSQYDSLLAVSNQKISATISEYSLDYLPISMTEPNEFGARGDPRDANWASMFLFGRWAWDGYLFGGEQNGNMIDMIDKTYQHGFNQRKNISDTIYNFGGYPHGYFCSAYNAGYGSAALRGEQFRDAGIKAYEFMLEHAMSGPFSWWEGIGYPDNGSPWAISHASKGGGSCPHMWGQSTATKVLFDSLICEKSDGSIIIGRGIPNEWLAENNEIEVQNYPVSENKRIGFNLKSVDKGIQVRLLGDKLSTSVSIELPSLNGKNATIPKGSESVWIDL